ncbi:hypothetical protein [Flavobacterium sp. MK4S-17]|uniref:hypothetical protein n=1 Tax=Flavobacterium sp. MK4S-17 TaxID=2543737 RepID=UPI001357AD81|nr:hypothetical protein [Flavobacterium sp. MK4S-17]
MKINFLFLLIIFPLCMFAQKSERELLKGKVISDSLKVEYLSVYNLNAKTGNVTDDEGNFVIYARPADTLKFAGIAFKTMQHIVTAADLKQELFVVKIEGEATQLEELLITDLTGNLAVDSKNTKVMAVGSKFNAAEINKNLLPPANGVNIVALINLVAGKKKEAVRDKRPAFITDKPFPQAVRELYSDRFFTETLKVPQDEIGLFLTYCDNGNRYLLDPRNEIELISYLDVKSREYLKINKG